MENANHAERFKEAQAIAHATDPRCNRCGSKVDPMGGVVAKVEVRGELARLWHVECWNRDNGIEGRNRYWY